MPARWRIVSITLVALVPAGFVSAAALFWVHLSLLELATGDLAPDRTPLILGLLTLTVTIVSTASTIWLAWRGDRRSSRESALKIEQLELQLAEARAKAKASA